MLTLTPLSDVLLAGKLQLLGTKSVFKHQDLQMLVLKLLQVWVMFIQLKLWVPVTRHNFKWVHFLM